MDTQQDNSQKGGERMIRSDKIESVCHVGNDISRDNRKERREHSRINGEKMGVDCAMTSLKCLLAGLIDFKF